MSRSMKIPRGEREPKAKHFEEKYGSIFRRVGASPHNKIFCVRGMDIFLNTKEKSTALILFQKLREYTTMAFKSKQE